MFTVTWNEYDSIPLADYHAFTKRFLRETSDEALMTQLANRSNTNSKLYGNAGTNEVFHGFSNRNQVQTTTQFVQTKETNMGLIAKKMNDIKKFKEEYKFDSNWNAFDDLQIIQLKDTIITALQEDHTRNVHRLQPPQPSITTNDMIKRGFSFKPKQKSILQRRLNILNRNKSVELRTQMLEHDSSMDLFDINGNCGILKHIVATNHNVNKNKTGRKNKKRHLSDLNSSHTNDDLVQSLSIFDDSTQPKQSRNRRKRRRTLKSSGFEDP